MLEELVLEVGKREIDDKEKIPIRGALVKPNRRTDLGIIFVTGFWGRWQDYMEYFSLELGKSYPIYTTEIRHGGIASGERTVNDLFQIDGMMRDRLETDRIVYFGHSLGLPLGIETARRHRRDVLGYFGMATYPSFGNRFNSNPNITENSLAHSLIDFVADVTDFAPLSFPIKEADVVVPIQFVIGESDEITHTSNPKVKKRFENYFNRFPRGNSVTIPGNHSFNQRYFKFTPFNQDMPQTLIAVASSFLEQFT